MAKELPYFKWFPGEYITGDITLCSMEAQGVFANCCNYYWNKQCSMSLANAKQRYNKHEAALNELLNFDIIKIDSDQNIIINFLDDQMNEFISVAEKRAKAGSKGGKAKAKQMLNKDIANLSNKDKRKEDKNNIIDTRTKTFEKSLEKFINQYGKELIIEFYNYWTEPNKSKTKLRFELEKTWDTERRLKTWVKNANKFNKNMNDKIMRAETPKPFEGYGKK